MRAERRLGGWIVVVLAAWVAPAWAQDKKEEDPASQGPVTKVIRGRVVDEAGKPLAGVGLATYWFRQEDEPDRAISSVAKTDDQGRFRTEVTFCTVGPETYRPRLRHDAGRPGDGRPEGAR